MRSFFVLSEALDFIECNLENPITQETIAGHCYYSLSGLQKLFRYALHMTVKDYLDRRRLTQASSALLAPDSKVTEVAMRFQYQSPEVFARAFRRLWGLTPTEFRRTRRFSGLFPRVEGVIEGGNGDMRRKTDITELYDTLKEKVGTYVICFDVRGLMEINDISRAAGDEAIRESFKRIEEAATEDMLVFRIGGDEFAMVTGSADRQVVEETAARVLACNGNTVTVDGREIPVALRAGAMKIRSGNLRYAQLYDELNRSLDRAVVDKVHFVQETE